MKCDEPPPPPPPPSPPPPPQAVAHTFSVFFDRDKDTITPTSAQVIQQAVDAWKSSTPVQLKVIGYSDRSGSAASNQRLSERRANNVASWLVEFGVPQNEMVVSGHGANDDQVPTSQRLPEPQKRRVEILF